MSGSMISENMFLFYSALMGIFLTFTYDLFRIFRRVIPHKSLLVSLEDLCFWIFCAISVFLLMHEESNGTLRWFAVLGALTGMLLYQKTISPIFVKWVSKGLSFVLKMLGKILKILQKPFLFLGRKGKTVVRYGNRQKRQFLRFLKKRLTALLKMLKIILCKQ